MRPLKLPSLIGALSRVIASFDGAVFSQLGSFCSVIFEDVAKFNDVVFKGAAKFYNASVKGDTKFDKAIFEGRAEFDSASFNYVSFLKTTFGGATSFPDATFAQAVSFSDASFINVGESADFSAIRVERAFDLKGAKFLEVPSFSQADFKQAPDLDSVRFPLPSHCPWRFGEPALIPKYRAIRRMAIQGADYEREQMAFKGEIRSKRGTEHRWYHAAFWYGLAYDALSDFGRSMSRPSLAWLISIGVFGLFYLASSGKLDSALADCATAGAPNYESALIISWKNALPLVGDAKAEEIARTCLYGAAAYSGMAIQGLQKVWSTVLVFLFLLAVRNQFKIK